MSVKTIRVCDTLPCEATAHHGACALCGSDMCQEHVRYAALAVQSITTTARNGDLKSLYDFNLPMCVGCVKGLSKHGHFDDEELFTEERTSLREKFKAILADAALKEGAEVDLEDASRSAAISTVGGYSGAQPAGWAQSGDAAAIQAAARVLQERTAAELRRQCPPSRVPVANSIEAQAAAIAGHIQQEFASEDED